MQGWWSATAEPAVKEGKIRPLRVKVMPGGLAGVKDGWKYMEEGNVSGVKLVYRIGESFFLSFFFFYSLYFLPSSVGVDIFGYSGYARGGLRRNEGVKGSNLCWGNDFTTESVPFACDVQLV